MNHLHERLAELKHQFVKAITMELESQLMDMLHPPSNMVQVMSSTNGMGTYTRKMLFVQATPEEGKAIRAKVLKARRRMVRAKLPPGLATTRVFRKIAAMHGIVVNAKVAKTKTKRPRKVARKHSKK